MDAFLWSLVGRYLDRFEDRCSARLACRAAAAGVSRPAHSHVFYRIDEAEDCARRVPGLRTWAMGVPKKDAKTGEIVGTSRFFVATQEGMLRWLQQLAPEGRTFFEIISTCICRPGRPPSVYAVRAYIDTDVERCGYEGGLTDGEMRQIVVSSFIRRVRMELSAYRRLAIRPYVLMACSATKFSMHVVLHVIDLVTNTEIRFSDAFHIGAIVRKWEHEIRDTQKELFWRDKHGDEKFVVDLDVYTKRRQFRLMRNTKFGQTRYLLPDDHETSRWQHWENFLIQDHSFHQRPCIIAAAAEVDGSLPKAGKGSWCDRMAAMCSGEDELRQFGFSKHTSVSKRPRLASSSSSSSASSSTYRGSSSLEEAIVDWVRAYTGDSGTRIHRRYDNDYLSISTPNTRYCAIRGDAHTNNKVYFVANVRTGDIVQRCRNPVCGTQGAPMELSPELDAHFKVAQEMIAVILNHFS